MANLEDKLKELKKWYLEKLEGLALSFKSLLKSVEKIDLDDLYSKVHTISGTSGMYGLNGLSDISTEFEIYLKTIKNNPKLIKKEELKEKLLQYTQSIEKVVAGD